MTSEPWRIRREIKRREQAYREDIYRMPRVVAAIEQRGTTGA